MNEELFSLAASPRLFQLRIPNSELIKNVLNLLEESAQCTCGVADSFYGMLRRMDDNYGFVLVIGNRKVDRIAALFGNADGRDAKVRLFVYERWD